MANVTITDSSVLPKSITIVESGKVVTVNSTPQPVTIAVDTLTTQISGTLDQLTNVNITSLADNQILAYDSASSKWVNEDNSGGSATVDSVNGQTGTVVLDTDDIAEDGSPTNKYFTDARAQTVIDSNSAGFITADSTSTLTNKSGAVSQFTNDAGYLTSETDSQTLSLSTPNLSISGGNTVDLTPLTSGFITASSTDSLTNKSGNISMFTNDSGYSTTTGTVTPTSTDTFTNKSGAISQWTNDSGYLTSETDSQTLSFSTPNLTISSGNSVDLTTLKTTALPFSSITSTPTTVSGYGITDAVSLSGSETLSNKSGDISQWTNDSAYLTTISGQSAANLNDVNYTTTPTEGQVLKWDNANGYWEPGTASGGGGIAAVVDDTSPQLGGGLDVLAQTISSSTNVVRINDGLQIMAGNSLRFENSAQSQNVTLSGTLTSAGYDLKLPLTAPAASQYLTVDAAGQLTFSNVPTVITNNNQLTNGAGYTTNTGTVTATSTDTFTNKSGASLNQWTNDAVVILTSAGAGIADVEADTTPQLGGALDLKGQIIGPDSTRNYQIIGNQASPSSSTYDSFSSNGSRVFGTVVVEEVSNPAVNQRVHSNPKLTLISLDADRNDNNARFRCNYTEAVLQTNSFDVDPGVNFGRGFVGEFLSAKISNAGASAATVGQHSAIIVSPQIDGLTSNVTVQDQRGVEVQPFIASGGTVDNMYGIHYSVNNSGTVTNQYSLYGAEAGATAYNAGGFQLPVVTVSNLSTLVAREGNTAYVSDNSAGAGSVAKCQVFYDGSNWKLTHDPSVTAA